MLRVWHSDINLKETRLPTLASWYISYHFYKAGLASGYSNFSKEELVENAKKDLKALNTIVGGKKFLFSDTTPCDYDFALFGNIAQIFYGQVEPLSQYLKSIWVFVEIETDSFCLFNLS